jgi:hypothetical protein
LWLRNISSTCSHARSSACRIRCALPKRPQPPPTLTRTAGRRKVDCRPDRHVHRSQPTTEEILAEVASASDVDTAVTSSRAQLEGEWAPCRARRTQFLYPVAELIAVCPPAWSTSCRVLAPEAGAALTNHPGVDTISFTGRPEVGRAIQVAVANGTALRLFMGAVERIEQFSVTRTHWVTKIAGVEREFDVGITQQNSDERIAWRTVDGHNQAGVVTFHRIDDTHSRVTLQLDSTRKGSPRGPVVLWAWSRARASPT